MSLLTINNVRAYYVIPSGETIKAVDGVTLEIPSRTVYGLVGESGCGKSTLANVMMMRIIWPLRLIEGSITFEGLELTKADRSYLKKNIYGRRISIVPQAALNSLNPTQRIKDTIIDVLSYKEEISKEEILGMAKKRFEELNLPIDSLNKYPYELSGGMRQRVIIAISTLLNPDLLIVDEPTSALDVITQKRVLLLLQNLKKTRIVNTIFFITHDIAVLRQIADVIAVMYAGNIIEINGGEEIIKNPMHPYTKTLINSILTPEPEIKTRGITYILGEPPDLSNPPSGCRFHPRCPYAFSRCKEYVPKLRPVSNGGYVACFLHVQGGELNA